MADNQETQVRIHPDSEEHRVEALVDGQVAGFSDYRVESDGSDGQAVLTFTHTEVDDAYEGQGVGSRLARGVMDFARDQGARIVPECSFIRAYMSRHEETHDLLADGASLDEERKAG
jgi:predicted GNAT family acetyltransferase